MATLLLLTLPFGRALGQNLVPNHSFEEYDTCRVFNGVYYPDNGPLGWFSAGDTPDFFMGCLPYGSFNATPLSYWVFQYPQDEGNYAGVCTYREFPEIREYFMVELIEPLVVGEEYHASFYASPGYGGPQPQLWLATSGIGMIFTTQPRQWEMGDPVSGPLNHAHVWSDAIITDTVGWTLVSGSFVADSAYRYVMLGNAFDNASTDTLHFAYYNWLPAGYVVFDNVCVSADPDGCPMAVDVTERPRYDVSVFPNPATEQLSVRGAKPGAMMGIYDAIGRCVYSGHSGAAPLVLDVGQWPRGVYSLMLNYNRESRSFKFVLVE